VGGVSKVICVPTPFKAMSFFSKASNLLNALDEGTKDVVKVSELHL